MPKVKRVQVEALGATAKGRPDWVVVGLALLGVGVAGYLTALKLGGNQAFLCRDGSGCDIVQASRYSLLAGVPTAMWGAGLYLAIAALAAMPRTVRRWQATFMLASGAVAFSLYLTYLSIFVIGATCPYCLASGVIAVLLLLVMVLRRPHGEGRDSPSSSALSSSPPTSPRRRGIRWRWPNTWQRATPPSTAPSGDPRAKSKRPGSGLPSASCRTWNVIRRGSIRARISARRCPCAPIRPG